MIDNFQIIPSATTSVNTTPVKKSILKSRRTDTKDTLWLTEWNLDLNWDVDILEKQFFEKSNSPSSSPSNAKIQQALLTTAPLVPNEPLPKLTKVPLPPLEEIHSMYQNYIAKSQLLQQAMERMLLKIQAAKQISTFSLADDAEYASFFDDAAFDNDADLHPIDVNASFESITFEPANFRQISYSKSRPSSRESRSQLKAALQFAQTNLTEE